MQTSTGANEMLQILTPGTIVNVSGIPAELKAINQWVVWKPMLRKTKLVKVPVSYAYPLGDNVNAHDPLFWTTFDEAVAVMRSDPRFGIGIVLDGTGIICLDFDDHHGDDADAVRNGAAFMADIQLHYPTYVERSLQGQGKHSFYRATLPHGRTYGDLTGRLNLEVYAAQFIAITGNVVPGSHTSVNDGQALVDAWNLPPPVATTDSIDVTTELGRYLTADDSQVIMTLKMRRETTFNMLASSMDLVDRSTAYAQIVGDLDKITGDPRQIDRIIRKCPFFKNSWNSVKYEQSPRWLAKQGCQSMLEYWLKQARADNDDNLQLYIHVTPAQRAFMDELLANTFARHKEQAREAMLASASTEKDVAHDVKHDSPIARLFYILDDEIGGNFDHLTVPPGVLGEFVNALGEMLAGPRLTYMLPAVISTLSGYIAQTFKLPLNYDTGGVNQFMIAGKMNTGKSSTMTSFAAAVSHALRGRFRHPHVPHYQPKTPDGKLFAQLNYRMIDSRAVSTQGMFDTLAMTGASVWFADEAESQIDLMLSPQQHGVALKGFVKNAFDKCKPYEIAKLDVSRTSMRSGVPDIMNMTLPFYWAATSEVFGKLSSKEMLDGLLSRINLIFDEQPMSADTADEENLAKGFPERLGIIMRKIAFIAEYTSQGYNQMGMFNALKEAANNKGGKDSEGKETMETYAVKFNSAQSEGAKRCRYIEHTPAANELRKKIKRTCRAIGADVEASDSIWPPHYMLMARTETLTSMVASILAVCDMVGAWRGDPETDPDWHKSVPQVTITEEHLQWSFEFVMHWRLRLFKAWDSGKIAIRASQDITVIQDVLRQWLKNPNIRIRVGDTVWVPHTEFVSYVQRKQPFAAQDDQPGRSANAGDLVRRAIDRMAVDGLLIVAKGADIGLKTNKGRKFITFNNS